MANKQAFMVINKSIFGQAPLSAGLAVVGAALILLFTVISPEASKGLGFWERLLFWSAQVSVSLLGIVIASMLVRHIANINISNFWLILITGIVASIVVSPAFIIIENLFVSLDRLPDSALDEFAQTGVIQSLIVQAIETMPALTIVWFLVNIPILLNSTFIDGNGPGTAPDGNPSNRLIDSSEGNETAKLDEQQLEKAQFISKLPDNIGTNIMYISSDLHYLNVTTEKGAALVLGSIAKVAEIFDEDGFLVHRSHWVNKSHVARVVIAGSNAQCIMQNGKSIPISRSKRKLLKAYFGNNNPVNNDVIDFNSNRK